ncbi:MAG TPA: hypothetical protein VFP68_03895 [Burkholderiaceae bacterium]|nr:hypothetical protein [Burkholderiaceae bacterium]
MRVTIQAKIERADGTRQTVEVLSLKRALRQEAFLASIGIGRDVPVTVLCDGGEDVYAAGRLGERSERVLDWFHIGMRFEHLQLALQGLRVLD